MNQRPPISFQGAASARAEAPSQAPPRRAIRLVPRLKDQGYDPEQVAKRRRWVEKQTGANLDRVGQFAISSDAMRGNIENPVGAVQMPLGIAGPLWVKGEHAEGEFYVPLATTEGALVRSYERGMVALTRAGGAEARLVQDENRVCPMFHFESVAEATAFCRRLPECFEALREAAQSTTSHGRLLRVTPLISGRKVIVEFSYYTADAHGMNMIVKATEAACQYLRQHVTAARHHIFSGYTSEKRASGSLLRGGKGKKVTAGAWLSESIVRSVLHISPQEMVDLWQTTVVGHLHAGVLGYNGHYANGLTALFIATGQDVANVANSSVGVTQFELTEDGGLYASVTLPSLSIATVGGGTSLGTSRECLEMLDCAGPDKAPKLAEITAAMVLAGELSMGAAIASDEFVEAHETYGRNRPRELPRP